MGKLWNGYGSAGMGMGKLWNGWKLWNGYGEAMEWVWGSKGVHVWIGNGMGSGDY